MDLCRNGHDKDVVGAINSYCLVCKKEAARRYRQGDSGRAARKRYKRSEAGRAATQRYRQSEAGRAARKKQADRYNEHMLAARQFAKNPPVEVMMDAMSPWFTFRDRDKGAEALRAAVQGGLQAVMDERARNREETDPI